MESLPNEFLSHHLPLMFFAGLEPPSTNPTPQDKFASLIEEIRKILSSSKSSHPQIWNTRKTYPTTLEYRVILVPKTIRFPPRKTRPSSVSTTSTNVVSHSPLSPLSQTSPLFPNGIMTPIWVRKHRDMIPSVFVLALRLWEPPSIRPNDENPDRFELEKHDDELIHEIIERKKTTSERGIKLTVIILTSRYMLDNPQLDARLSYIRKRSSLDARASLFVLSPVPAEDVVSFINTLKAEVFESAIDYYREHSRRVRRKRSRSSSNAFSQSTIYHQPGQPVITPLGPQGWNVRSDYKLATFAEFRQEFEVAIKSYEDSWEGLIQMFNSTAILPPRTKRWAEAKIFIDCINFKISKLYLYSNEPTRAMYQFNKHINKFRELFNGWGIGDETFEFWSWLSKQYTVLADLVDIGCRNGMRLPNLCPPPPITTIEKNRPSGSPVQVESRLTGGGAINLTGVLVHPGFYYFHAAQCAVERRNRFRASNAAEEEMRSISESNRDSTQFQPSIALAHERKVNHAEMIISLYTKAYEIFKTVGSNRMTLFLALKIALVHHHQNDHTTSYKFFERILASYRKGNSNTLFNDVLYLSFENLKGLVANLKPISPSEPKGVPPETIQLLKITLELVGKDVIFNLGAVGETLTGLIQPLSETASLSEEVVTLDIEPSAFPVGCQVAFWESSIHLGEEVEFQVLLRIPQKFAECKPPITQIKLKFTSFPVLAINHQSTQLESSIQILDLESVPDACSKQHELNLQVKEKSDWLITGRLKSSAVEKILLEKVFFRLENILNGTTVEFAVTPDPSDDLRPLKWFEKFDNELNQSVFLRTKSFQSFCHVQHKKPNITFTLDHKPCGILDERQSLQLEFRNLENDSVNLKLKVKLQSPSSHDSMECDNQTYSNSQDFMINLGCLKADQVVHKSLDFMPTETVGLRVFEISLAMKIKVNEGENNEDDDDEKLEVLRIFKSNKTASIYIEELVGIKFTQQNFHQLLYPSNCNIFKPPANKHGRVRFNFTVVVSNSCHLLHHEWGHSLARPVLLRNLSWSLQKASCSIRIISCSLKSDASSDLNIELNTGNSFAVSYVVELELNGNQEEISNCFFQVTWDNSSSNGEATGHVKQVPIKIDPPMITPITVLTDLKAHLKIFEPLKINYFIENRNLVQTVEVVIKIHHDNDNTRDTIDNHDNHWILSGPKFINSFLILPRSFKSISFVAIPTKLGLISAPKIEIYHRIIDVSTTTNTNTLSSSTNPLMSTTSLTNLKDLQELVIDESDQDVSTSPTNQASTSSFVQLPVYRSNSSFLPPPPNLRHDLALDISRDKQSRCVQLPNSHLFVFVLPST